MNWFWIVMFFLWLIMGRMYYGAKNDRAMMFLPIGLMYVYAYGIGGWTFVWSNMLEPTIFGFLIGFFTKPGILLFAGTIQSIKGES